MVRAFADVPATFASEALNSINATFGEFKRRAETRGSRTAGKVTYKKK